jgi:hypothetical protein
MGARHLWILAEEPEEAALSRRPVRHLRTRTTRSVLTRLHRHSYARGRRRGGGGGAHHDSSERHGERAEAEHNIVRRNPGLEPGVRPFHLRRGTPRSAEKVPFARDSVARRAPHGPVLCYPARAPLYAPAHR